jgi:hypothetical protein
VIFGSTQRVRVFVYREPVDMRSIRSAAPVRKRTAASPAHGPARSIWISGADGLRPLRRHSLAERAGRRHRQRAEGPGQLHRNPSTKGVPNPS